MVDLNAAVDSMAQVLQKRPLCSVGIIVGPILTSERIKNGLRGEARWFGDQRENLWSICVPRLPNIWLAGVKLPPSLS